MKRVLLVTILTVSSLISFAKDYYIVTANLNVRSGEGTNYPVSITLQKGSEVEVLSANGDWYRIEYLGKIGYAHSKYLEYSGTISDTEPDGIQQTVSYVLIGISISLVLFVLFWLLKKIRDRRLLQTVTQLHRGEKTERNLVLKLLKYGIPSEAIFHDLYVENSKGGFSQTDLVVVTEVGIIVFEVKDYSGWLYGSGSQLQWTQVLAYGNQKYRFYNPIMQNNNHVAVLRKQLVKFKSIPFYSVIVFYGDCVLKEINYVPNGTFLVKPDRVIDVIEQILTYNQRVQYTNDVEILRTLEQAVKNGGIYENQIRHTENIKDMLGKNRIFE